MRRGGSGSARCSSRSPAWRRSRPPGRCTRSAPARGSGATGMHHSSRTGWDGARTTRRCTSPIAASSGFSPFRSAPPPAELGAPRDFISVPQNLGVPDGAALDEEGCYWLAIHGGGRLRRYRPDGQLDRELMLPVSNPTMCAFAGPALETLFITTASHGKSEEAHAGGLFRCRPGMRGLPCASFAG